MAAMDYISFNQKFRPKGITRLQYNHSGIDVKDLHPAFISSLDLQPQFMEDCSAYARPPVDVQFPRTFVAVIPNGRIFAYDNNNFAVMNANNEMIADASFQWVDSPVEPDQNKVFSVKGFSKPKKYSGRVFSLLTMGAAKDYYFHWMFDAMTKLALLRESGLLDTVDYFLVPSYKYRFNKEYLGFFGISEDKIINEEKHHHIQADELIVSSEVRVAEHLPKWGCDFFYETFAKGLRNNGKGRSIYIARGDAARSRKVSNESQVIKLLKEQGFEILYLTRFSVLDQVKLFNSADRIVAVHGGGLSNLVYCEPGTKVLEIFPDQYVRHYFYDICVKRELEYDYLLSESDKQCFDHFEGEVVGLTVDLDAMQKAIDRMTGRKHMPKRQVAAVRESLSTESMRLSFPE
jgi:hypothetical protein